MKKKGFTLIELLAVILVLGIIAVIAIVGIGNVVEDSKKKAAEVSTLHYVDAIEKRVTLGQLQDEVFLSKDDYTYDEIPVDVNGTIPSAGKYELQNDKIVNGVFCVGGYTVNYVGEKAQAGNKCDPNDLKYDGLVTLSNYTTAINYPGSVDITITQNLSEGALSCATSDSNVATCSISGDTLTITAGLTAGSADITITSAATSKYKEAKAVISATRNNALLNYEVEAYDGLYDGQSHTPVITCDGATITFSETENGTYTTTAPSYTAVGEYKVYFKVNKPGYTEKTGSLDIKIKQLTASDLEYKTEGGVTITVQEAIDDLYSKLSK